MEDHLDEYHCRTVFMRICRGVDYLHNVGIWHRDLKPANILLNSDCSVKLCDFGLARAVGGRASLEELDRQPGQGKRDLTAHVVTRWYRAPELILLHTQYTQAIDVWSLGCILVELLMMEERYCPMRKIKEMRKPMFPGGCCYPLSPRKDEAGNVVGAEGEDKDQMKIIFHHIGTPSPEEFAFLSDENAKGYIMRWFPHAKAGQPVWFNKRLPGIARDADDLLRKMLMFNPAKRLSMADTVNHPFFEEIRKHETKRGTMDISEKEQLSRITLPFPDAQELDGNKDGNG